MQAALAPGQPGADVALSIGFFCDLGAGSCRDKSHSETEHAHRVCWEMTAAARPPVSLAADNPTPSNCGLRKTEVDVDVAPFAVRISGAAAALRLTVAALLPP